MKVQSWWWVVGAILLVSSNGFAARSCEPGVFAALVKRADFDAQFAQLRSDTQSNPSISKSMKRAILRALDTYYADGHRLPPGFDLTGTFDGSVARQKIHWKTSARETARTKWIESFEEKVVRQFPTAGSVPVNLETVHGAVTVVQRFEENGKTYYFRPTVTSHPLLQTKKDMISLGRFTLVASELNLEMGLDTNARTVRAIVNGVRGVVSEAVPETRLDPWSVIQASPKLKSSDTQGFEFLIGTYDLHRRNLKVADAARTFDYDETFINGLPLPFEGFYDINTSLPADYTPKFLSAVLRLDRQKIQERFSNLLTPEETEGILFRREIIIRDAELRGFLAPTR